MPKWRNGEARSFMVASQGFCTRMYLRREAIRPLFREVASTFKTDATLRDDVFEGVQAVRETTNSVVNSNMEPAAFAQQLIRTLGVPPKSGIATELSVHFTSLYLLSVIDGVDLLSSTAAEHCSRRILQQVRAAKRNGRNPDFEGLEFYLRHMSEIGGMMHSAKFDAHVASVMRDTAQIMKQDRMQREEEAALEKSRKGKKGKDRDDDG